MQTTQQPISAELLFDFPGGERDERFPGVQLLTVDHGGQAKTTAERVDGGWRVSEWELTEELDGALSGMRCWYCSGFFTIFDDQLARLIEVSKDGSHEA